MATNINFGTQQYFGFDPRTLPNCVLWLDAADSNTIYSDTAGTTLASTGGTVARWNDKSSNANFFSQATAGNRPTYTAAGQNTLNVITFTRASSNFITANAPSALPSGNSAYSSFVVARSTLGATVQMFLRWGGTTSGTAVQLYMNGSSQLETNYLNVGTSTDNAVITNNTFMFSSSTTTASGNYFRNGTAFTTITSAVGYNIGTSAGLVGAATSTSDFLNGFVSEVILYNRNLGSNERQNVEGYLAWKWGLGSNLPTSQPFRYYTPAMRLFQPNDISGISLWLDAGDASTITLSGSSVLRWADKSGSLFDASGGISPTYSSTSNAVVFNGSTQYLVCPYSSSLRNESVFLASHLTTSSYANFPTMIGSSGNGGRQLFIFNNGGFQVNIQAVVNGPNTGANTSPTLQNVVYTYLCSSNTATSNLINMFINGTQRVTSAALSNFSNGLTCEIGRWPGGNHWQGNINEIVAFSNTLLTFQRQQIEGYLAWKWGAQERLPTTHPFSRVLPSTPIFNPLLLSSCALWLDAADSSTLFTDAAGTTLAVPGNRVQHWRDKSGSGKNATQGTTANSPLYSVTTFPPSLVFNANNQEYLVGGSLLTSVSYAIFVVAQFQGTPGQPGTYTAFFDRKVTTVNAENYVAIYPYFLSGGDQIAMHIYYTNAATPTFKIYSSANPTPTDRKLFTISDGTGVTAPFFLNGSVVSSTNSGSAANVATDAEGYKLGVSFLAGILGNYFTGRIYEVIVYTTALSSSARQQVEGYLTWKWGLQSNLPTTHPYSKFRP